MENLDIDSLRDNLEDSLAFNGFGMLVERMSQKEVKDELNESESGSFSMISFESTKENPINVSIDESKFLNDKSYGDLWIKGSNGDNVFFLCVSSKENEFNIEAIEVSEGYRMNGIGKSILEGIETFASDYNFDLIRVHPFDSDAESFWKHMGFEWSIGYSLIKKL